MPIIDNTRPGHVPALIRQAGDQAPSARSTALGPIKIFEHRDERRYQRHARHQEATDGGSNLNMQRTTHDPVGLAGDSKLGDLGGIARCTAVLGASAVTGCALGLAIDRRLRVPRWILILMIAAAVPSCTVTLLITDDVKGGKQRTGYHEQQGTAQRPSAQ